MKKLIFVVFLLLFTQGAISGTMDERVSEIEGNWADVREAAVTADRKNIFLQLAEDITDVVVAFPSQAEPLILKSAILLTMAEDASSFVALGLVNEAKDLLQKAIGINPEASQGSALVTLGVLYYKVPSWPVAFGDNREAEAYLLKALEVNPEGIDSNYYYAEFLLEQGKKEQAVSFLNRAIDAKIDSNDRTFKMKIKEQEKARIALANLS
ncbi:MAG: tetratricopeptide repeat protein [Methylococcaceae bacterium]|nr:tetratricopeptide repeat protein [Methylococcaceae bacterium]